MGTILALDHGLKRVGLAISDPGRSIASPLGRLERPGGEAGFTTEIQTLKRLVREHGVDRLVMGLPVHTSGRDSPQARAARQWGDRVAKELGLTIIYVDERYSTKHADELMREAGLSAAKRKRRVDSLAAVVILRDYLDAGCPDHAQVAPPIPLDDPLNDSSPTPADSNPENSPTAHASSPRIP
ncbi:Holliday junction resolvase YqgF [Isosphaera pallida ATCC 43644]|jgi:putative Holliday junction resolvase|uniref:Putative pre-16S rRNA nuclease n=1 Tax=Isosphaera pallida (strain ATCC 43644 / DSM 9630 / IS1B) TaxID=575540 RepID=E8QXZ6_ISOPI|nr:Holliday junction resolvase RuvX [Isosphaera pallida]ADV60975.1 Holliday junction resolvase YqgF [Isosphaera pallida ATCC 43644]